MLIVVKFFLKNLHSCQNFRKYRYFVKTVGNLDIGQNFLGKSSFFNFFFENLDFVQTVRNSRFWSKFLKMRIFIII